MSAEIATTKLSLQLHRISEGKLIYPQFFSFVIILFFVCDCVYPLQVIVSKFKQKMFGKAGGR